MLAAILPFAMVATLVSIEWELRLFASLALVGFGTFLLVRRRHPRMIARIRPTQLGLWSFAVAIAHGAGLMLVPIYLGLCRTGSAEAGHAAAATLAANNLGTALMVTLVHTGAMLTAGGLSAWFVYRYFGLKLLSRSWFNLDAVWAVSLIVVGILSLVMATASTH
jgi:hypothetical protein